MNAIFIFKKNVFRRYVVHMGKMTWATSDSTHTVPS